jgi:hypothetical protein
VEEKAVAAVVLYHLTMDQSQQAGQQTMAPVIHLAVEEITLHLKNEFLYLKNPSTRPLTNGRVNIRIVLCTSIFEAHKT